MVVVATSLLLKCSPCRVFKLSWFDMLQETPKNELHKSFFVKYLYYFHGPGSQITLMADDVKKD